jgi:outer membrane protein assembly factor BamB
MRIRTDIWNQLGGNPAGSGCRLVNSVLANARRWEYGLLGDAGTRSPVIGPDGTIYIGTDNGQLVAVQPTGYTKWRITLGGPALGVQTPAVADDGTVYCLLTPSPAVHDHRTSGERGLPSYVVAVQADGTVRWRVPIRSLPDLLGSVHCSFLGAPRIVSGPQGQARIVFVLRYQPVVRYPEVDGTGPAFLRVLAIVDEQGRFLLFSRYEEEKLFIDVHGGGGLGGGATLGDPPSGGLAKDAEPCLDTPVVFGSFAAREPWTIIAPGQEGLYRLTWSEQEGALARAAELFALPKAYPAPAAFPNGLMTGGDVAGATLIDVESFTRYAPNAASLGGPATVAGGLRQMYFVVRSGDLLAVDSNGSIWKRRPLQGGSVAFPALSGNHLHVATTWGLETFSLDLEPLATVRLSHGGYSSPAIGPDGTVYVGAGPNLYAFFDVNNAPRVRDHRRAGSGRRRAGDASSRPQPGRRHAG